MFCNNNQKTTIRHEIISRMKYRCNQINIIILSNCIRISKQVNDINKLHPDFWSTSTKEIRLYNLTFFLIIKPMTTSFTSNDELC